MEHLSEILELILRYSNAKKLADENFVIALVNICSKKYGLQDYVKNVEFTKNSNEILCTGLYEPNNKVIKIYSNSYKLSTLRVIDFIKSNPTSEYLLKNIIIVQTTLHELEHALQRKIINSPKDGNFLEQKLLFLTKSVPFNIYDRYYDLSVDERLAEIHSYQRLNMVLELINATQS